jgi:radical SAM protein with 4Fe4S-binding SPASM domain
MPIEVASCQLVDYGYGWGSCRWYPNILWFAGGALLLSGLKELKIELTQECPLACVHCSTSSTRKQHSALPESVVLRLLREGAEIGVEKVVFTGGEPLVSPYVGTAIQTASSLGIHTSLYTTGITDNRLASLSFRRAEDLVRLGLRRFIFSIYSARPSIHDSVTRYGSHAATLTALQNAVSTRAAVEVHFVAMKRNFRDLSGVVQFAATHGIEKVSVLRFVPQGRGKSIAHIEDLDSSDLLELTSSVVTLRVQYPGVTIRTGSPFNILGIGHTPCNAAKDVLVINHRGEIFPCDAFKNVRYPERAYGSILNMPLLEVWQNSEFLQRVRGILTQEKQHPCAGCSLTTTCQSGCLAQKVIRDGWQASMEPDPNCLIETRQDHRQSEPEFIQITVA